MVTPQSFAMASRTGLGNPARESPPAMREQVRTAPQPVSTGFELVRLLRSFKTSVPVVDLPVSLAGPAPSGHADASRHCQGCSRPPRRLRLRLPSASLHCCDSAAVAVFHLHPNRWRLVAHSEEIEPLRKGHDPGFGFIYCQPSRFQPLGQLRLDLLGLLPGIAASTTRSSAYLVSAGQPALTVPA